MALAKLKPNSGNRTPGSSSGRWGHRAEVKKEANKLRREEAKRDVQFSWAGSTFFGGENNNA